MFSTETLKFISFVTKFGCGMGLIPFSLDIPNADNSRMTIKRIKKRQWFAWITISYLATVVCVLKAVGLVNYIFKNQPNSGTKGFESTILFESILVLLSSYGFLFHLNTILYGDEVEDFFNHVMRLNRQLRKLNIKLLNTVLIEEDSLLFP